jgi:hypothetical protein
MIPIYPKSDLKSLGINGLIYKSYLTGMVPETNLISYLPNEIRRKMHIFNVKSVRDKNVYMESFEYLYIN